MSIVSPFRLALEPEAFQLLGGCTEIVRRLSDMRDFFADEQAVERVLTSDDPVIYEFWKGECESSGGGVSYGLTRIHPGTVGREYHMTKGHFHTKDGDEIYVVVEGRGLLLLQTREGEGRTVEMTPGHMVYVPTGWAHRTVNTGDAALIFLSIWPPGVGHDYGTVARYGFPQLVVQGADGPMVVRSPSFQGGLMG